MDTQQTTHFTVRANSKTVVLDGDGTATAEFFVGSKGNIFISTPFGNFS